MGTEDFKIAREVLASKKKDLEAKGKGNRPNRVSIFFNFCLIEREKKLNCVLRTNVNKCHVPFPTSVCYEYLLQHLPHPTSPSQVYLRTNVNKCHAPFPHLSVICELAVYATPRNVY